MGSAVFWAPSVVEGTRSRESMLRARDKIRVKDRLIEERIESIAY